LGIHVTEKTRVYRRCGGGRIFPNEFSGGGGYIVIGGEVTNK